MTPANPGLLPSARAGRSASGVAPEGAGGSAAPATMSRGEAAGAALPTPIGLLAELTHRCPLQ